MKTLNTSEIQQVSGGVWVVSDNAPNPIAVGYVIGVLDTAYAAGIIDPSLDSADLPTDILKFSVISGKYTIDEILATFEYFSWV